MNLTEAFKKTESYEFAAYLGAASDLKTFLRAAQQQEVVHFLKKALSSPQALHEVFFRIYDLSRETVDLRYENRWDTALGIYLWLIRSKDGELARLAADIAQKAPQISWAMKIAQQILGEEKADSFAGSEPPNLDAQAAESPN